MRQSSIFLFFVSQILCLTSFAVPEVELMTRLDQEILPYFKKNYHASQFIGKDQIRINFFYSKKEAPKGVIVFSPGQSESSLKYAEFLYDMKDSNYDIFIIDHRGQGNSGRLLKDPVKSHVEKFSDYVEDFSYFVNTVVKPNKYQKSFLMAHSMGGAIAAGYLINNPKSFTAHLFLAPMFQVNTGFFGNSTASVLANILDFSGFSDQYAPTQKAYDPNSPFEKNTVTSSRARFEMKKHIYNLYPELRIGGTTTNWLKESLDFTFMLRYKTNQLFQSPTLLIQAGRDQFVRLEGQNRICESLNPDMCQILRSGFETSEHELLMEVDSIRNQTLAAIQSYLNYFENK
jgi:lysophospholipase